jgi:hypothetical protein
VELTNARQRESYLKDVILKTFGNKVQDASTVNSSHGTYHVEFDVGTESYSFHFKPKSITRIARAIRALKLK